MTTHVTPTTPPSAAPARTMRAISWPFLHLVKKIISGHAGTPLISSPLPQRPPARASAVIDIGTCAPGTRVRAFIGSGWLTATIVSTTGSSALVTYQVPGSGEMMVETVHATRLQLQDMPVESRHGSRACSASDERTASEHPAAGDARAILGAHRADEHGMCSACADLAHFAWAPCPEARQAALLLAAGHVAAIGGA
jgi:hypothetical protein